MTLLLLACTDSGPEGHDTSATASDRGPWTTPAPSVLDAPARLVGFADVHGDYQAAIDVLKLAGLIDDDLAWTGGDTVVVQTGDQLDRGDGEQAILDLFELLSEQAWDAGGGFYPLLGNHETMNVQLDLRYVTDGGFEDFADTEHDPEDPELASYPESQRGRVAAFRPGGPYATLLAGHNLTMQVGGTVFVHGGILPDHATAGLQTINDEVRSWMLGEASEPQTWVGSSDAPVWTRVYSDDGDDDADQACSLLEEALDLLGADRMVVGHTVQDQANPACNDRVWRVDVGMADYYGGRPAAVEIVDGAVTLLE